MRLAAYSAACLTGAAAIAALLGRTFGAELAQQQMDLRQVVCASAAVAVGYSLAVLAGFNRIGDTR